MIVNKSYEIASCDDVELNIKRDSLLEFRISYDDEREIETMLFIVSGLGGDADSSYKQHLAEFAVKEFGVAVVIVNYHCIGNRPQVGSVFCMDKIDQYYLAAKCQEVGIPLSGDLSSLESYQMTQSILLGLNQTLSDKKAKGELPDDYLMELSVTIQPTKNEYQNFGIMQAQDLINTLLFIKNSPPFKVFGTNTDNLNIIMLGSSHGGYLAHMAAKIAPWLIDGVIDNSCYANNPFSFIGFGKEVDYKKYYGFSTTLFFNNINIFCSDKTYWTLNQNSPNYFSEAREEIRYLLNLDHLKIQSGYPKPIYVSYHSVKDTSIAPASDKAELYKILREFGFDATLNMIKDESEIDGKFIKNLEHGMNMSIKSLIKKELSKMIKKLKKVKKEPWNQKSISYKSVDLIYKFYEMDDKINLAISKTKQ